MNRLVAAALFFAVGGHAFAADLPTKAPPVTPWRDFSWNGVYAGVGASIDGGRLHGTLGTVTAGINFQSYSNFVFGLEGDVSGGKLNGSGDCACNFDTRWLGTFRGRAGYTMGRTLIFGTVGFAAADINATGPAGLTESTTKFGYALGAGVEFDLYQNLSLRVDYRHVDFGNVNCSVCGTSTSFRSTSDGVQVGVVLRFFSEAVEEVAFGGPGTKPPPPR